MSSTGGRIPESFIQSVLNKTDIVSLIQEKISLKKNGANYSACCPFHQEKTPSFSVSPTKQFYHCFGCSAHGDAIAFLMAYQSMTFVDALETLANRLGLSVPKDPAETVKAQLKLTTSKVLNKVAEYYANQLKRHPKAKEAIEYLKNRGLTGAIARDFSLGFAPPGWDNLLRHFNNDDFALKILEETGLIIKHPQHRFYDRFRDRIMFPIKDKRGDVYAFGARVLDNTMPKYLNSPESSVFQKGRSLYGIYEALTVKNKWHHALVVEGYMDVVALAQMGIKNAVATLGTAVTDHHITSLFQVVNEIIFCFDGDKAGQAAAFKALQLVMSHLSEDRQVKFVHLPLGEDPDSFIRTQGVAAFEALISQGMPLSSYFFSTLCQRVPPDSMDSRARLANLARSMIENIPSGIFKEMMFEQLAQIVSSTQQVVRGEKALRHFYYPKIQKKSKIPPAPAPIEPAFMACAILLKMPSLFAIAWERIEFWREVNLPGIDIFIILLNFLKSSPGLTSEELKEKLIEQKITLKWLSLCEGKLTLLPQQNLEAEFRGTVRRLEVIGRQLIAEKLLNKAKHSELSVAEKTQLKEFLHSGESIS